MPNEWQDAEEKEHVCLAQQYREYLRSCQEDGCGGDEQRKAHAPKMPRDSLYAENTAAHEHPKFPRGGNQSHGTKHKVPDGGNSVFRPRRAARRFETPSQDAGSDRQCNQNDQIKRQDAAANIARWDFMNAR